MVSMTSKKAYRDIQAKGITSVQQNKILAVVERSGIDLTRREISHHTKLENSCVAGRVNEMMGLVFEEGLKRKCRISKRLCGTVKLKGE